MDKKLAFRLIDQASEMNVPSMKFNWRGEPLLNPELPEIISYAKSKGILETIINTNVTQLDTKLSKKIISSGLDLMIISFDGGSKKKELKTVGNKWSTLQAVTYASSSQPYYVSTTEWISIKHMRTAFSMTCIVDEAYLPIRYRRIFFPASTIFFFTTPAPANLESALTG